MQLIWRLCYFNLLTSMLLLSPSLFADSFSELLSQLDNLVLATVTTDQVQGYNNFSTNSQSGNEPIYTRQLLGYFVDGVEQPAITALYGNDEYLLPLITVLESTGVRLSLNSSAQSDNKIRVSTPGGDATFFPEDLVVVDGQIMLKQAALIERLLIDTRFEQSSFAIYLQLPWNISQSRQPLESELPKAQFNPPLASLRNLRADFNYYNDGSDEGIYSDYFLGGNLAGGGWRFRMEQDDAGKARPFDYYWSKSYNNSQTLLGNADFSLHPLLPSIEQTGVQILYSTAPIPKSGNADITQANGNRGIANGIRTISGIAAPGSVAELRIDGRRLARTRVRLDGSYDFPDVELPTRGYTETVVLILDRNSGVLLETQDFSRRSGIELLGANQHSVFATLGQQGNLLDESDVTLGSVAATQWRYGLTEDLTLELGHQQVGDRTGSQASLSMAISRNWFGSLGYARESGRTSMQFDLEGGNDRWQFDLNAREFDDANVSVAEDSQKLQKQWARSLNYRFQLSDSISLGVIGRDSNTIFDVTRFVLPSVTWNNRKNFSVSVLPNFSGSYRIDSRFSPNFKDTARYTYESGRHLFDYRYRRENGQELYTNYRHDKEYGDRFELGMVLFSSSDDNGRTSLGLINSEGSVGYTLDWESSFFPGFNSRLRLSKGDTDERLASDDGDLFIQWQMTLDFAVAQNRIIPADSNWGSLDSAALTGELLLSGKRIPSGYGVDRIELLVDGDSRTAVVQNGRYYIDGLQPGLHKISIDSRFLPIELMPKVDQSFWVRLEGSAVTEVPLALEAKFAIAGRIRNAAGNFQANEVLVIYNDNNRIVANAVSDQYGLFRADNLPPGEYTVAVIRDKSRVAEREFRITEEFLFDQDLVIP